jgi:uncharacterized protein (TIGR02646 family)
MIKVKRGEEPDGFSIKTEEWWKEFQQTRKLNPELTPTIFWTRVRRRKEMKHFADHLCASFNNKCAFCESKMQHVSPAHVEHFRPMSRDEFWDRMLDWNNWLLSCSTCNTNKGAYFDECDGQPCLIDPVYEDPAQHLGFLNSQILYKTDRGHKTIRRIRLDRIALQQRRSEWLITIRLLLLLWLKVPEASSTARDLLIWAMQADAPYTAMTRAYLNQVTPKFANPVVPHEVIHVDESFEIIRALVERHDKELGTLL